MRLPRDEFTAMCSPSCPRQHPCTQASVPPIEELMTSKHDPDPGFHVDGRDAGNVLVDGKRASRTPGARQSPA